MAFSLGASAFLVKPFGIKELLLTMESVLGQSMIPPPERSDSSELFGRPGGSG